MPYIIRSTGEGISSAVQPYLNRDLTGITAIN